MRFTPTFCVIALLAIAGSAQAELLGLEIEHYPRVFSLSTQIDYVPNPDPDDYPDINVTLTSGLGLLTAYGVPWEHFAEPAQYGDPVYSDYGDFALQVTIDKTTKSAVEGYLLLQGAVLAEPPAPLFTSSSITDFGFGGDDLLEFMFEQEGPGLPPDGEPIGIILSGFSIPDSIWSQDIQPTFLDAFANAGNGQSNTFYLPEPTVGVLLLAGLGAIQRRRLIRRR